MDTSYCGSWPKNLKTADQSSGFTDGESEALGGTVTYPGFCCRPKWNPILSTPFLTCWLPPALSHWLAHRAAYVKSFLALCVSTYGSIQAVAPLKTQWHPVFLSPHNTEHSAELLAGIEYSLGKSLRWAEDSSGKKKKVRKCMGKEKSSLGKPGMLGSSWPLLTMILTVSIYQLMSSQVLGWDLRITYLIHSSQEAGGILLSKTNRGLGTCPRSFS